MKDFLDGISHRYSVCYLIVENEDLEDESYSVLKGCFELLYSYPYSKLVDDEFHLVPISLKNREQIERFVANLKLQEKPVFLRDPKNHEMVLQQVRNR